MVSLRAIERARVACPFDEVVIGSEQLGSRATGPRLGVDEVEAEAPADEQKWGYRRSHGPILTV
jgi:hypothetical protein